MTTLSHCLLVLLLILSLIFSEARSLPAQKIGGEATPPAAVLTDAQWEQLDSTVDHALEYLAMNQEKDGSFEANIVGQPVVTSLCVLAFMSRGHTPTEGPYAKQLSRAIDFVLSQQQANGLLCRIRAGNPYYSRTGAYNHAINGLMLCEAYGMTNSQQQPAIRSAIEKALALTPSGTNKTETLEGGRGRLAISPARILCGRGSVHHIVVPHVLPLGAKRRV